MKVMEFQKQQELLTINQKKSQARYFEEKCNNQVKELQETEVEYRHQVEKYRKIKIIFDKLCEEKRFVYMFEGFWRILLQVAVNLNFECICYWLGTHLIRFADFFFIFLGEKIESAVEEGSVVTEVGSVEMEEDSVVTEVGSVVIEEDSVERNATIDDTVGMQKKDDIAKIHETDGTTEMEEKDDTASEDTKVKKDDVDYKPLNTIQISFNQASRYCFI